MGVHGYSSLQGLRLFQKQGRLLAPDIVTLYYGWNDHWLTDVPDRQQMGMEMRPFAGRIFEMLRHKRIFHLVVWALNPVQHVATREHGKGRVPRVAPDEYHSTLTAFVRDIRAAGAIPVLITAPRRSLNDEVVGKEYVIARLSSNPSLSGENGFGDNESPAANGILFVNMLFVCRGVAPNGATDVLQLRLSLPPKDGLIRSSDLPAVGVLSEGLCHDGE